MVPSSHTSGAPTSATHPRILVVEDELLIRFMLGDELRDAGYEVVEACDADEAVAALGTLDAVDLIISDVRMPGSLDGLGLLGIVRTSQPELPVIIMSSHLEPRQAAFDGATQFLAKPFTMDLVLGAVRAGLQRT